MENVCEASNEDSIPQNTPYRSVGLQPGLEVGTATGLGIDVPTSKTTLVNGITSTVKHVIKCNLEADVHSKEQEYCKLALVAKKCPAHCLICNAIFPPDITNGQRSICIHSTFSPIKWSGITHSDSIKTSVFRTIGHVLGKSLGSVNLHSESICDHCFDILVSYSEIEVKLSSIRSEVVMKFENTAKEYIITNIHEEINTLEDIVAKSKDEQEQSTRTGLKPMLIITEEGKVVDENGKEKNTIFKVDKIAAKTKSEKTITSRLIKRDKTTHPRLKSNLKVKQPYLCPVCGKSFRAFSHRVEHMLIHLGEKPWNCDECKKKFRTKSALKYHSMKHTGERPFTCTSCGKSFADKYYFDQHCRIHSGERPFECSYCVRRFARKKDLAVHMRAHTGDKPFKCSHCSKTFAVKSRLDRHSRTHSGIKPHTCEFCNKSFSRQDDCKVHVRQHTGERPFCCSFCEKTFTNKSNCLVHIRTHTGSKAFSCLFCSASYDRQSKVDEHMAATHAINKELSDTVVKQSAGQGIMRTTCAETVNSQQVNVSSDNIQSVSTLNQPLLCEDSLHTFGLSETQNSSASTSVQGIGLSVGQVTQLWSEGSSIGATTFVNIPPGTYVNIITDGNGIISA